MQKRFVVVSGLPGSGKTTLAWRLASVLELPVIDKDSILEGLFDLKGVGDTEWRRMLSRESDRILQAQASASEGAILVSFWHRPGMALDSGTPTTWLTGLAGHLVNLHCVCPPEIAAERFFHRERHRGHLDVGKSYEDVLKSLREVARLPLIEVGRRVEVDTCREVSLEALVFDISRAFPGCAGAV
jgi:AAA domain